VDLAVQELGWSSGLLDPEVRSVEVLRKYIGGQGGRSFNGDAKSYRAARLTGGAEARHGGDERRGFSGPQQWNGRRRGGVGC